MFTVKQALELSNVQETLVIGLFEKTVIKLFPGKDIVINKNALYLDNNLLRTPEIALDQTKKELFRITKITQEMFNHS